MSSNYNVLLKFGINVTNKVQRKRSSTYLLALCLTFCSLIYVFCAITFDEGEDLPQIIVNVPHLDRNLSGKKGEHIQLLRSHNVCGKSYTSTET